MNIVLHSKKFFILDLVTDKYRTPSSWKQFDCLYVIAHFARYVILVSVRNNIRTDYFIDENSAWRAVIWWQLTKEQFKYNCHRYHWKQRFAFIPLLIRGSLFTFLSYVVCKYLSDLIVGNGITASIRFYGVTERKHWWNEPLDAFPEK